MRWVSTRRRRWRERTGIYASREYRSESDVTAGFEEALPPLSTSAGDDPPPHPPACSVPIRPSRRRARATAPPTGSPRPGRSSMITAKTNRSPVIVRGAEDDQDPAEVERDGGRGGRGLAACRLVGRALARMPASSSGSIAPHRPRDQPDARRLNRRMREAGRGRRLFEHEPADRRPGGDHREPAARWRSRRRPSAAGDRARGAQTTP